GARAPEAHVGDSRARGPRAPDGDDGSLGGLRAGADAGQPADRGGRRAGGEPGPGPAGQRRDGGDRRPRPRPPSRGGRVLAAEQPGRRGGRARAGDRRARGDGGADLHERQRRGARPARVPADLRRHGRARPADLDAPGAAGGLRRLRGGAAVEVRPLVGVRLAVRDERRHGAAGLLRTLRSPPGTGDHHASPGRDDSVLRGPDRRRARPARRAQRDDPEDAAALGRLRRRPIDYFRMFYGDTALFGAWHAMESGLAFFGADHVLFGTDFPFDPEQGPGFVRDTILAMERMRASEADKAKIYEGNARRLLRLRLP